MGRKITKVINRFDGGMSNDWRSKDLSKFALASHFDVFTYPYKLVPRDGTEDKESGATDIVKFLYADRSGTQTLFGFDKDGSNKCLVRYWNGVGWVELANNTSSSETRMTEDEKVFFHYKDFIYMWAGGTKLKRFDTTGALAFNDSYQSIAYTTIVQPVHHLDDDIAYFFSDNKVHKLNDTVWSSDVLTLPDNLKIVSARPYGKYLAIACITKASISEGVKSFIFLWDRDAISWNDMIEFGNGKIIHIATLEDKLTVIMQLENAKKIAIKNIRKKILNEIILDDTAILPETSQIVNEKLYFPMKAPLESDNRFGIWVVDSNGKLFLDFVHTTATSYEGIYFTGDIWWMAHSNDGSISRTTSTSGISVYKSLIIGNGVMNNKLLSVGVMTTPLPSNGNYIKLEYLTNNSADWNSDTFTEIFNKGTRFKTFHEARNIESDGSNLGYFRELKLKITINNKAVHFTGIKIVYEEHPDNLI